MKTKSYFEQFGHRCVLVFDTDYDEYLRNKFFLKKILWKHTTISRTFNQNIFYLRSYASIKKERFIHLKNNPWIIHPLSNICNAWELLMIIVYTIILFLIPFHLFEFLDDNLCKTTYMTRIRNIVDIICLIECIRQFFTGYFNYQNDFDEVILDKRKIMCNYIKTYFFIDFISSIRCCIYSCCNNAYIFLLFELFALLKFIRLKTLLEYIRRFLEFRLVGDNKIDFLIMIVALLIYVHWCCCLQIIFAIVGKHLFDDNKEGQWIFAVQLEKKSLSEKYVACIFRGISIITGSGYAFIKQTESSLDMLYSSFLCVSGRIFSCVLLSKILEKINIIRSSSGKYEEMMNQLQNYMKIQGLPNEIQNKVKKYYTYKYEFSYFKEDEILNVIPTTLRQNIIMHSARLLVEDVTFFANLPSTIIAKIVSCLHSEIVLSNDVIMRSGTRGDCMYFITSGTVAIFTPSGREIGHLKDGSYFGEIALINEEGLRVASVVAVETCELYRLDRKDFYSIINPYPDLIKTIEEIATERIEHLILCEEKFKRMSTRGGRSQHFKSSSIIYLQPESKSRGSQQSK